MTAESPCRGTRKTETGVVLSNKMNKTVVVRVQRVIAHPRYDKRVTINKKYYAHSEQQHNIGDTVTIMETRPLSKLKRWRVVG